MAEALYRKYRPQIFEDVVGQEHIERTIKNAIDQDKVSHAYLFTGPRGTGKTTTARLLAKALLCEHGPTAEPDGTCADCEMIAAGEHPDVYELDAASRTGVENVREEIIGRVSFAPTRGRYKIYIIDEVHMLSTAAFNALLKTLEEPPSHVVFILATTDPQKVPETIHSRCQRFDFRRISSESIVSRLGAICVAEGVEFEGEALDLIAHRAEGGMRNALTSLEQLIAFGEGKVTMEVAERMLGSLDVSDLAEIVRFVGTRDVAACFRWTAEYVETGADLAQFTRDFAEHIRNMYVMSLAGADVALDVSESTRRELTEELPLFGPDRLARLLSVLGDLSADLKTSTNPRLSFEIALTRMVRPDSDLTLAALAERVEALESGYSAVAHVVSVPAAAGASSAAGVQVAGAPAAGGATGAGAAVAGATGPGVQGGAGEGAAACVSREAHADGAPAAQGASGAEAAGAGAQVEVADAPQGAAAGGAGAANGVPVAGAGAAAGTQVAGQAGVAGAAGAGGVQVMGGAPAGVATGANAAAGAGAAAGVAHVAGAASAAAAAGAGAAMGAGGVATGAAGAQGAGGAAGAGTSALSSPAGGAAAGAADAAAAGLAAGAMRGAGVSVTGDALPDALLQSLRNPAALQRMWQSVLAALKKGKAAYGVLFLNTKAVFDEASGTLAIEFPAENDFAFKTAQGAGVQEELGRAIAQACGVTMPFMLTKAGARSAGVTAVAQPAASAQVAQPAVSAAASAQSAQPAAGFQPAQASGQVGQVAAAQPAAAVGANGAIAANGAGSALAGAAAGAVGVAGAVAAGAGSSGSPNGAGAGPADPSAVRGHHGIDAMTGASMQPGAAEHGYGASAYDEVPVDLYDDAVPYDDSGYGAFDAPSPNPQTNVSRETSNPAQAVAPQGSAVASGPAGSASAAAGGPASGSVSAAGAVSAAGGAPAAGAASAADAAPWEDGPAPAASGEEPSQDDLNAMLAFGFGEGVGFTEV